jgi:hypothetical protein
MKVLGKQVVGQLQGEPIDYDKVASIFVLPCRQLTCIVSRS